MSLGPGGPDRARNNERAAQALPPGLQDTLEIGRLGAPTSAGTTVVPSRRWTRAAATNLFVEPLPLGPNLVASGVAVREGERVRAQIRSRALSLSQQWWCPLARWTLLHLCVCWFRRKLLTRLSTRSSWPSSLWPAASHLLRLSFSVDRRGPFAGADCVSLWLALFSQTNGWRELACARAR